MAIASSAKSEGTERSSMRVFCRKRPGFATGFARDMSARFGLRRSWTAAGSEAPRRFALPPQSKTSRRLKNLFQIRRVRPEVSLHVPRIVRFARTFDHEPAAPAELVQRRLHLRQVDLRIVLQP